MKRKVEPGYLLDSSSGPTDITRRYLQVPQSKLLENNMEISAMASIERTKSEELLLPSSPSQENWLAGEDDDSLAMGSLPRDQAEQQTLLDYSSHPSVLGPGYSVEDIGIQAANVLPLDSSGVVLVGLNRSAGLAKAIRRRNPLLSLEVECELGRATDTGFRHGKSIAKATWRHLKNRRWHMDQIISNIQASHQKMAWKAVDVDPASQEAYELAAQGPVKPDMLTDTIIYGIRCVDWKLPAFTLKVECVGENQQFVYDLVSEMAIRLKTHGHCTKVRCSQVGPFTANQSLLPQQFNLENVLRNIGYNKKIVRINKPHHRRKNFTAISDNSEHQEEDTADLNQEDTQENVIYGKFKL